MRVHAIQTGTVLVRSRQRRGEGSGRLRPLRTMTDRTWTEPLPIYAWLVEHPEGLIMVDTGETARAAQRGYFPRWHPYFRLAVQVHVAPEEEVGPRMRALGFSPDDVRWVVLTHLHTDHAGGLGHFPRSEILVRRTELDLARGFPGQLRGYLPHRWPEWFTPRAFDLEQRPYGPFPESLPLTEAGDVTIVGTDGHTPGHVSVVVADGDGCLFLAGDASYSEELLLEGAIDGVAPDAHAARRTLERIQALAAERPVVYLPAHDPGAKQRLEARAAVGA